MLNDVPKLTDPLSNNSGNSARQQVYQPIDSCYSNFSRPSYGFGLFTDSMNMLFTENYLKIIHRQGITHKQKRVADPRIQGFLV